MTYAPLSKKGKKASGISEGLIRISAGLEDADDLIDELNRALK